MFWKKTSLKIEAAVITGASVERVHLCTHANLRRLGFNGIQWKKNEQHIWLLYKELSETK